MTDPRVGELLGRAVLHDGSGNATRVNGSVRDHAEPTRVVVPLPASDAEPSLVESTAVHAAARVAALGYRVLPLARSSNAPLRGTRCLRDAGFDEGVVSPGQDLCILTPEDTLDLNLDRYELVAELEERFSELRVAPARVTLA